MYQGRPGTMYPHCPGQCGYNVPGQTGYNVPSIVLIAPTVIGLIGQHTTAVTIVTVVPVESSLYHVYDLENNRIIIGLFHPLV